MSFPIQILRQSRQNILDLCTALSLDQLNHVPDNFNNNLIWNAGHVIATQQLLCYGLGGQKAVVPNGFIDRYRKGTSPDGKANGAEWTFIQERLLSTVEQFHGDLTELDFSNFREYTTSYGVTLRNIGQALSFNNTHEGLHLGTMIALRKLV